MQCYHVTLVATAQAECTITVEANSEAEAREKALAVGDHCWDLTHGSVGSAEVEGIYAEACEETANAQP